MSQEPPCFPVFVGRIHRSVSVNDLRQLFSRIGRVLEVTIISDYGFVTFAHVDDAVEAVERYNGRTVNRHPIHVDYSEELAAYMRKMGKRVVFTPDPLKTNLNKDERLHHHRYPGHGKRPYPSTSRGSPSRGFRTRSRSPGYYRQFQKFKRSRSRERTRSAERRSRGASNEYQRSRSPPKHGIHRSPQHHEKRPRKDVNESRRYPSEDEEIVKEKRSHSREGFSEDPVGWTEFTKMNEKSPRNRSLSPKQNNEPRALSINDEADLRMILEKKKMGRDESEVPEEKCSLVTIKSEEKDVNPAISIQVKFSGDTCSRLIKSNAKGDEKVHSERDPEAFNEIVIGNLLNEVEEMDIKRLFEPFGKVEKINMEGTEATVFLDNTAEMARQAAKSLDMNLWMDNNISVSVKRERRELVKEESSVGLETKDQTHWQAEFQEPKRKNDKRVKIRHFLVYSSTRPRTYFEDLRELFSRFGSVVYCDRSDEDVVVSVHLRSSEKQALKCISEMNNISYKGNNLRVKFHESMEEDALEFRNEHSVSFRCYPQDLIPPNIAETILKKKAQSKEQKSELPIGVLPPSSSLGAFAATPDPDSLSAIIQNVRSAMRASTSVHASESNQETESRLSENPEYASAKEGEVNTIHNKLVLIKFHTGFSNQLAKFIPGQMYVNGRHSLGFLLKNHTFNSWPLGIKKFLFQGSKVKMDVKKMTPPEIAETMELTNERVLYSTHLVWKISKPNQDDLILTKNSLRGKIFKGVVKKLHPKWAILETPSGQGVFLEVQSYVFRSSKLSSDAFFLDHLTVGDTVGIHCRAAEPLEISEIARASPGFSESTVNLIYLADLVWQINTELDPFTLGASRISENFDEDIECNFLSTSNTLNIQLPSEREAVHTLWTGVIEEIHLPAGGIIRLDSTVAKKPEQSKVYFHRSRIYLNGAKFQSNLCLDSELAVGDRVTVDVVPNQNPDDPYSPPIIFSHAHWVAVAMRLSNRDRGLRIAQTLRGMESVEDENSTKAAKGRIIFLNRPDNPQDDVCNGIAVIDTGPHTGQRVEFEREQCFLYGYSLARADISLLFSKDDEVMIEVKPYNSFCVDCLFIGQNPGAKAQNDTSDENQRNLIDFLQTKSFDQSLFEEIVHGKRIIRPFIPFKSQSFRGKISSLESSSLDDKSADIALINVNFGHGNIRKVKCSRDRIFVFGHWMGKADLRYILDHEDVWIELAPLLDKSDDGSLCASLMWLGHEDDRPAYDIVSQRMKITVKMDEQLWPFVRSKNMDERMFRALVEGRLAPKQPSIEMSTSDGSVISLDKETLAEAALLQQMKRSFGTKACLKAMMMLMAKQENGSGGNDNENQASSSSSEIDFEEMKKLMESLKDKDDN